MANKSIIFKVLSTFSGKGVDDATKDFKKLGGQFEKLNRNALKLGASFAAMKVGQLGMRFIGDSVNQARDLTRNLNGLQTVFQGTTPQMVEFAKNASDMGLSMNQAAKASTFIGSVLKQSGFSISETADLTERLVGLGTDLAITYGYDVQEALLGMTALFRGEYDPIEKFGVAMKQNEINIALTERGMGNLTGASRRLAEQQIRVEFLFDRASDALGQYSKQAGTLFAAQQTLRAEFENLQAVVGFALTPVFAELALALRPLVVELAPVLLGIFKSLIPAIKAATDNKEEFVNVVIGATQIIFGIVKAIASFAKLLIENIVFVKNLAIGFVGLSVGIAVFNALKVGANLALGAIGALFGATKALNAELLITRIRIAATGFGLIAVGIGAIATMFMTTGDAAENGADDIKKYIDEATASLENLEEDSLGATATIADMNENLQEVGGSAAKATDAVGDFFRSLGDDAAKLSAKLELETLGASESLINKILGSGDQWFQVFKEVTRDGMRSVQEVQAMFLQTGEGFQESLDAYEAEFDAFTDFKESAEEALASFQEFTQEFEILPSISRDLGRFEQSAVEHLESIEEKLKDAFDNGQLLDESYQNLLEYSRTELGVLQGIERQRDELLARRDAAAALINSVQDSVRQSADIVKILDNAQDAAEGMNAVQFATEVVHSGRSLKEFSTALISDFAEPIETARSKADLLVDGYRSVVERTREFVENIKALKALGLDPQLFNQLVEAGVEAGGETAKALVEGGSETINELNSLFGELDALGAELGENTAQVMFGQGENFVNGIVDGLDSQLEELENMADSLAESFTTTFEEVLVAGIERAIAAAEAALSRMPQLPGGNVSFGPGGSGGGSGGGDTDGSGGAVDRRPLGANSPAHLAQALRQQQRRRDSIRRSEAIARSMGGLALTGGIGQPEAQAPNSFAISAGNGAFGGPVQNIRVFTSSTPDAVTTALQRYQNRNQTYNPGGSSRKDLG